MKARIAAPRAVIVALAPLLAVSLSTAVCATTLHPGDKVAVSVYNHPELAAPAAEVDSSGQVSIPLAGLVPVADQTPQQAAARIADRLVPYVRKVAVDVQLVSQGQNIFVTGGPGGTLTYLPGETLMGALAELQQNGPPGAGIAESGAPTGSTPSLVAAHNFSYGSVDLRHVVIERDGSDLPEIDATKLLAAGDAGVPLHPDDTIKLRYKPIAVPVLGEVNEPGVAHLDESEPLSDALLQVGGTDSTMSAVGFVLKRAGAETTVTASSPQYKAPAQVGDSIYVPHASRIGVVGMVAKPGDVLLRGDSSLLSALYYAGGPTKWGDIKHVTVVHQGVQSTYDITKLTHGDNTSANPILADGDTVFVPEGHKIDFTAIFSAIVSASYLRFL